MPTTRSGRVALSPTAGSRTSPATTGHKRSAGASSSARPAKTRRGNVPSDGGEPSPFDDDDEWNKPLGEDAENVDLTNATEVPDELKAPKEDNRVKLGKFQCVICMDDTTALTVTHCGHLFCSECLHSALNVDASRRKCPVCRQNIDDPNKKAKNVKTFHHLELKIMTKTKQGKMKDES
ncbi:hypothetical protein F5Y16DRAFT_411784 [Xylariaceae sp. FL0255]|nr:hypothetical protein F5Y16DRAFT_411784 [Xylariaceae sp. FL0255]